MNCGRKVGHVGGLIVGLRQPSGTFCRRRQRGSTGAQYAGSSGLINIKRDDALLHLLTGHYPFEPCRSLRPEGWLAGAGSGTGLLVVVSLIRSSYRRIVEAGQYGVPSLPVHRQLSLNCLQGTRVVLAPFHVGAVGAHVDAVLYGAPLPTDADVADGGRADVGRAQLGAPVISESGGGAVNDIRFWRDGAGAIPFWAYLFQFFQL